MCLFLSKIWSSYVDKPDPSMVAGYDFALQIIPFAVIIEMLSEPVFIYLHLRDAIGVRIKIDIMVLTIRCFGMAIFIPYFPNQAVKIFTMCLLCSSISQTFCYILFFKFSICEPLDKILPKMVRVSAGEACSNAKF